MECAHGTYHFNDCDECKAEDAVAKGISEAQRAAEKAEAILALPNTPAVLAIQSELAKFVPNGSHFPVLRLRLEGNSELQAVHDYGDQDSPLVWQGTLTVEEMRALRKAKLCQTHLE